MENQDYTQATEQQAPVEMIEIKFSRKLARPFTTKNGKDMVAISIPNQDQNDKRPWEEFVLPVQIILMVVLNKLYLDNLEDDVVGEIRNYLWKKEDRKNSKELPVLTLGNIDHDIMQL